ncbi:hypothetical protein GCM10009646_41080 [Streptomyces aureus]
MPVTPCSNTAVASSSIADKLPLKTPSKVTPKGGLKLPSAPSTAGERKTAGQTHRYGRTGRADNPSHAHSGLATGRGRKKKERKSRRQDEAGACVLGVGAASCRVARRPGASALAAR